MDVLDLMETKLYSFTKTDRIIYEWLKKHPRDFATLGYDELSKALEVSPSALTRFAKRLGCAGNAELQAKVLSALDERGSAQGDMSVAAVYGEFLQQAERTIDRDALMRVARHINDAGHVWCLGFHLSSLPASFLATGLESTHGIDARCERFDFTLKQYDSRDVLIIESVASGEYYQQLLRRVSASTEDERPYVALITMNGKHPLRRHCDEVILLPSAGKVSGTHLAVLENMLFMMLDDLLIEAVDKVRVEDADKDGHL